MPRCKPTNPEIRGPVVCPMSITDPNIPIAEPLVSLLLKSAMKAEVAEVTMDKLNPKRILKKSIEIKDLKREKLPIQIAPRKEPKRI